MSSVTRCVVLALLNVSGALCASYQGSFTHDDDAVFFTLSVSGYFSARTWSFAGGVNGNGDAIAPGGFAPVLSLFDPSGVLIGLDHAGGVGSCAPRAFDLTTNFCWDAFLEFSNLTPGEYILVLTEDDNIPLGPTLADGFLEQGFGDFTTGLSGFPGPFRLINGEQRDGHWALDVSPDLANDP